MKDERTLESYKNKNKGLTTEQRKQLKERKRVAKFFESRVDYYKNKNVIETDE